MSYYILADYLIPPLLNSDGMWGSLTRYLDLQYYADRGYEPPRNYTLIRWSRTHALRVVFHAIGHGLFMISAGSQRHAYETATTLHGLMQVLFGHGPNHERGGFFLHRVRRVPQPTWSLERMRNELTHGASRFSEFDWLRLQSGVQLDASHLKVLPAAMGVAVQDQRIREALVHFVQSRSLFDGYMVGSYYHSHYA